VSFSASYMMIIGAGGDPEGETTIFDKTIKNLGAYVKENQAIKVEVALDGGHSKTKAIIDSSFPSAISKSDFEERDYRRIIQTYKTKLETGEIKTGDQLLIHINSHGAERSEDSKTHKIATSAGTATNLNTLAGSIVVNLDDLEILKKLAKEKGVKLAIIDGSCYSGNTLVLADDNTCVISATGSNHYSYPTFSENFSAAMKKGKNLEDVFLAVRAQDGVPQLPMISTSAGQAVAALIYDKITPYMYYFDEYEDKLMTYLLANHSNYQQCIADKNFTSLMDIIKLAENLRSDTSKSFFLGDKKKVNDLGHFKESLEKYKKSQDQVREKMRQLGVDRLQLKETFHVSAKFGGYQTVYDKDYTISELITSNFPSLIAALEERLSTEKSDSAITQYQGLKSLYLQAQARKEALFKEQPDLESILAEEEGLKKSIESYYGLVYQIAYDERKLYDALYKNFQKKELKNTETEHANPCKSFKL
jgi:hypothetical protein